MKSDVNGFSTCPRGGEQFEEFYSSIARAQRVQYDYRTPAGQLFSTIAPTLEIARARRDTWLAKEKVAA